MDIKVGDLVHWSGGYHPFDGGHRWYEGWVKEIQDDCMLIQDNEWYAISRVAIKKVKLGDAPTKKRRQGGGESDEE